MDKKDVVKKLISILEKNQKDIGEEVPEIGEKTKPVGDLIKFDSLMGVALTVTCCQIFQISDIHKIESLFVDENDKGHPYALNIGQIADRILTLTK